MGEQIKREHPKADSPIIKPTDGTPKGAGKSADAGTTHTGTGAGADRRTGTGAQTVEDKKSPRLVNVDAPTEPEKKKGRGRPKGTTKKKAAAKKPDHTQLKILLKTISDIIATREGMSVWSLSMEEVEQIVNPLANILEKNEALSKATSEYSDVIALVVACGTIFIPRFIMWQATKPKKQTKAKVAQYARPTGKPENPARSRNESAASGTNSSPHAVDSPGSRTHFGNQLSAIGPILG